MGLVHANINLRNARKDYLTGMDVDCLVDTGAMWTCIPEHVAMQLGLEELEKREVTTADGKQHSCSFVGPLIIGFENRKCFTGALILGDSVLLGVIQLEDMDLLVNPLKQMLTVNPANPNMAAGIVKGYSIRK